jgi:hypothetical protein
MESTPTFSPSDLRRLQPPSSGGSLVDKRLMIATVTIILGGVWAYARFGEPTFPSRHPHHHSSAPLQRRSRFIATPGMNFAHINVRAGPGAQYRIRETVERGATLIGIGRTTDSTGAFWIVLADGRGFVKESVLAPANGTPAP